MSISLTVLVSGCCVFGCASIAAYVIVSADVIETANFVEGCTYLVAMQPLLDCGSLNHTEAQESMLLHGLLCSLLAVCSRSSDILQ